MINNEQKESRDEIIQEVRRIKQSLAEAFDFDIDRILDDARRKQWESGRQVLSPPNRNRNKQEDHETDP